jgi:hypothetical protein
MTGAADPPLHTNQLSRWTLKVSRRCRSLLYVLLLQEFPRVADPKFCPATHKLTWETPDHLASDNIRVATSARSAGNNCAIKIQFICRACTKVQLDAIIRATECG